MIAAHTSIIAKAINGQFIGSDLTVSNVFTDSRAVIENGLFVALKGPNFDAHNFLSHVIEQGVKAVVVEQSTDLPVTQIVVDDTRLALGKIAQFNRKKLQAKMVAITGSNGKTTVKEMLSSILSQQGKTLATEGNLNNDLGAPLTLLKMNQDHDYGVIELGANHAGEIAYTAGITQPDVAVINNVSAAHIEGFGSLQGVANAKGEIYSALEKDAVAVVNDDDEFADFWKQYIQSKMITYSTKKSADVIAEDIQLDENYCATFTLCYKQQKQKIQLPLSGFHHVNNALSAATCAIALDVSLASIAEGLAKTPVVKGRLISEVLPSGCRVIDDTYNANLDSMRAAIDLLKNYSTKKILVIGDMAELGKLDRKCHEQIGELAKKAGIDELYSYGVLSKYAHDFFDNQSQHFSDQDALIQELQLKAKDGVTILVKGSRSAQMERVVEALRDAEKNIPFALEKGKRSLC